MIHTVKGFGIVNEAEVDVFLELSCFSYDSVDVGNLISGSSAFSKSSLNIWKFTVYILLKPGLENFAPYSVSREVPRSVLKSETVLAPLMRPQKFPIYRSHRRSWHHFI